MRCDTATGGAAFIGIGTVGPVLSADAEDDPTSNPTSGAARCSPAISLAVTDPVTRFDPTGTRRRSRTDRAV